METRRIKKRNGGKRRSKVNSSSFKDKLDTIIRRLKKMSRDYDVFVDFRLVCKNGQQFQYKTLEFEDNCTQTEDLETAINTLEIPEIPSVHVEAVNEDHSPLKLKKRPLDYVNPSRNMKEIHGLPGRKKAKTGEKAQERSSRCHVCDVVFASREDKKEQKKHGIQNTWIGCGFENCENWVHVRCSGHKIKRKKEIEDLNFLCQPHVIREESNEKE